MKTQAQKSGDWALANAFDLIPTKVFYLNGWSKIHFLSN